MGRSALAPGALRARWTGDPLAGNLERTGVAPFLRALTTGFRAKQQAPTSSATLALTWLAQLASLRPAGTPPALRWPLSSSSGFFPANDVAT